jgi:hypothetical protein
VDGDSQGSIRVSELPLQAPASQDNEKNAIEGDDVSQQEGLNVRAAMGSCNENDADREQHGTENGMIVHRQKAFASKRRTGLPGPPSQHGG